MAMSRQAKKAQEQKAAYERAMAEQRTRAAAPVVKPPEKP